MKKAKKCLIIVFFLFAAGCGSIGMMVSPTETFSGEDSLILPVAFQQPRAGTDRADIIKIAEKVGKDMGYSISEKKADMVCFASGTSLFTGVMVGKTNYTKICISKEGDMLKMEVLVVGNFGSGSSQDAVAILTEFKKRLMANMAMTN